MIERVENRWLEEPLELEATEDELPKCRKSKIKYTRALLLELTEAEVCRKLPNDFDVLLLRLLDGGSDAAVEHKSIIGKPFDHGPLLPTTWNLAFPVKRWDNQLYTQSKLCRLRSNYSSETKEFWHSLPQKPEKDAGVMHSKIRKSDLFQLSKTENPYRPPHLNKKILKPLATASEPGVEISGEPDRKGSADDIAGHEKSGRDFALASGDDSTKEPVGKSEAFRRKNEENEVIESSKPLDEYEDFWRKSEGNVVISANKILEGLLMDDNEPTFDDFWVEILETIHLQKEPNISPTTSHADSEVEIHFPDEESLTSVDPLRVPENSNNLNLDDSNGVADSEAEINLPDEDSLISMNDMIAPYSSMPALKCGLWEADKVTSKTAIDIRKNSKSGNVSKIGDYSKRPRLKAQQCPDLSGLVTLGQLHSLLPHSLHSHHHLLCDQTGFPPLVLTHNNISCMPSLNSFTQSNIHLPFCPESTLPNTKINNTISQYSLLHQPIIFQKQPNHPLLDATCANPINLLAASDLDAMQFLRSTSQQAIYEGFGKSKAGK